MVATRFKEKKNPTEINIACLHYIGVLGYHVHTISVFVCAWNSRMVLWIRKCDQNMNPQSSERVKYRVWVNCPSKWLIVRTKSEFIWFRTEWRWGQKLNNNSVLCGWGSFQKLSLLLIKMATRMTIFFLNQLLTLHFWSDKLKSALYDPFLIFLKPFIMILLIGIMKVLRFLNKEVKVLGSYSLFFHELFDCEVGPDSLDVAVRPNRGIWLGKHNPSIVLWQSKWNVKWVHKETFTK